MLLIRNPGLCFIVILLALIGCDKAPFERPDYPSGPSVDENGNPIPARGWNVISFWGKIGTEHYFNTGGDWYIMIEHKEITEDKFTQVYINRNPEQPENIWIYIEEFKLSDEYIYIDDPIKAYGGWTYYVMIYDRYTGD